jgi:tetratricopeptide (TPR) repeat protein
VSARPPPPPRPRMARRPAPLAVLGALALLGALAAVLAALPACGLLDIEPPDQLTDDAVIDDAAGARRALTGAYTALQGGSYYGLSLPIVGDLASDNTTHTGSFVGSLGQVDAHALTSTSSTPEGIYAQLYYAVSVPNHVIEKVPALTDLDAVEKEQILGEAYFLRALHYHNLVRLWGDVPLITSPISSVEEAAQVSRAPEAEVYAQILSDLQQATQRMTVATAPNRASLGAARALRARVHLYREEWALAEQAAAEVEAMGYGLAPVYADLFGPEPGTDEDIFRVAFDDQNFNDLSFYYRTRREIRPTQDLADAYEAADARRAWNILTDSQGRLTGNKFRDPSGTEDVHVIRFAEVVLIRAEALARQGRLDEAVAQYNRLRARAGLAPHVLGADVTTQDEVLEAIWTERRLELAFEGDRWPDLVRTGRAVEVLDIPEFRTRFPIPQREIDLGPNMTQNPGY